MSFKDKFKTIIGLEEEEEYETEFEEIEEDEDFEEILIEQKREKVQSKPVLTSIPQNQTPKGRDNVMSFNENNSKQFEQLNTVIIREPNEYSDTQNIADCLKQSKPVFVNLQRLGKAEAKRVIDFLSGTIYAIDGDIKRVGTNLFFCTPKNIATEGQITTQELQADLED